MSYPNSFGSIESEQGSQFLLLNPCCSPCCSKTRCLRYQVAPAKKSARREARRFFFNSITAQSGSRCPRGAVAGVALEEQRLAGDGGYHRGLERLGDQERRFGAF